MIFPKQPDWQNACSLQMILVSFTPIQTLIIHVTSLMNSELTKISLWMKSNKLSVNIKKANYVIFKPKQKSVHMSSQISLDSIPLKQVTEVKFLGIFIIWLAPRAGKMSQILRCDWLLERARWSYLARSGLPVARPLGIESLIPRNNAIFSSIFLVVLAENAH